MAKRQKRQRKRTLKTRRRINNFRKKKNQNEKT